MPYFGAHMSAAGGTFKALEAAVKFGMTTCQLFTKNNNQWAGKVQTPDEVATFRKTLKASGLKFPTAHDSYLINLASPDEALWQKSVDAFTDELRRAEALGLSYLVMHPGAHMGTGEESGLERVAAGLDECHERCPKFKVKVLVELTAGQGTSLGYRFEHLATIFDLVTESRRLGVCLDTCHVFAAGYELGTREKYEATFREFDRIIGLKELKAFHLNDSKKPLGSRVDRHEHIGKGHLGLEPFRFLVNDPRFAELPMILETPKTDDDDREMDPVNLRVLHDLVGTLA
jgi:deoxyribonuclease IV